MKVYVNKCGIMHVRKKGVKRMGQRFVISGELMQNVAEYRYLGCVINEHVESKVMVDSRVRAGARALYMCLVEEVQSSCWRGSRGVICVAVGGNGAVSVVVQSRGMGIL